MDGPLANSASSLLVLHTLHFVDHALDKSGPATFVALALPAVVILATYAQADGAHDLDNASNGLHPSISLSYSVSPAFAICNK
jgi:hypothetical protein